MFTGFNKSCITKYRKDFMNVSPVQNNNSQSFGMAFRLKGDGAKKLATLLEEVNSKEASHITDDLIKPIHELKTADVIYDGKDVMIKPLNNLKSSSWGGDEVLFVTDKRPSVANHMNRSSVKYYVGKNDYRVVNYPELQELSSLEEKTQLGQKLLNAREIVKDMDKQAAQRAYDAQQVAEKNARIDAKAKELQDLYG